MRRILCFGDSNTYGYIPDGSGRYDEDIRWTGIISRSLGEDYIVLEEGLCGRTTIFEDDVREGLKGLDSVESVIKKHNPVDLFIIMLGTNDCKSKYNATPDIIAGGVEKVINKALEASSSNVKVLVISPILLGEGVGGEDYDPEFCENSEKVCAKLAGKYKALAVENNFYFLDASEYATASPIDREHLDASGHSSLAEGILHRINEIFKNVVYINSTQSGQQ